MSMFATEHGYDKRVHRDHRPRRGGNPFGSDSKPDWMDPKTYLALKELSLRSAPAKAPAKSIEPLQQFSTPSTPKEPTQVQIPSQDVFQKMLEYLTARSRVTAKQPAISDSEAAAVRMS